MPASITLSRLSWSTPDDRSLLSGLDLSFGPERAGLVGRNGVGKTTLLRLIAGELRPHSGTVTVNGSLGTLRQSVRVDPAETIASLFGATEALALLCRAENGEATAEELAEADWTLEARIEQLSPKSGLMRSRGPRLRPCRAGRARAPDWPHSSLLSPTSCSSTNPRTTSTGTGARR
jgi:ATPase subunit of ABC transporter with duplicated ATPase domains